MIRAISQSILSMLLALTVASTAWAEAPGNTSVAYTEVVKAIGEGNARYIAAYTKMDSAAFADNYDSNAARLGDEGNGSVARGRAAIEQSVEKFMNAVRGHVATTISTQSVYVVDDLAYEAGKYRMTFTLKNGKGKRTLAGQYVTVWKLQPDRSWKIYVDMPVPQI
jgi:uncharacterized protein (TIGR02246 family)